MNTNAVSPVFDFCRHRKHDTFDIMYSLFWVLYQLLSILVEMVD